MKITAYVNRVFAVGKLSTGEIGGRVYTLTELDYTQFYQWMRQLELVEKVRCWVIEKKEFEVVDDLRIEFVEYFRDFSVKSSSSFFDSDMLKVQTMISNLPVIASLYMTGVCDVSLIWSVFVPALSAGFKEFMNTNRKEVLAALSYVNWDDYR